MLKKILLSLFLFVPLSHGMQPKIEFDAERVCPICLNSISEVKGLAIRYLQCCNKDSGGSHTVHKFACGGCWDKLTHKNKCPYCKKIVPNNPLIEDFSIAAQPDKPKPAIPNQQELRYARAPGFHKLTNKLIKKDLLANAQLRKEFELLYRHLKAPLFFEPSDAKEEREEEYRVQFNTWIEDKNMDSSRLISYLSAESKKTLFNMYPYFNEGDLKIYSDPKAYAEYMAQEKARRDADMLREAQAKSLQERRVRLFFMSKKIAYGVACFAGLATLLKILIVSAKGRSLLELEDRAQRSREKLLAFDFDMFGSSFAKNPLTIGVSVNAICDRVPDEALRDQLHDAIVTYDELFAKVYEKIISQYYYYPVDYFRTHESSLITQLDQAVEQLKFVITSCKKVMVPTPFDGGLILAGTGIATVCGLYGAFARYNMMWGMS